MNLGGSQVIKSQTMADFGVSKLFPAHSVRLVELRVGVMTYLPTKRSSL